MKKKAISNFEKYVNAQIKVHFSFLGEKYDFEIVSEDFDTTHTSICYKNKTTAVIISLDQRMGMILVTLIRLVNKSIPEIQVHYSKDEPINYFCLGNLLDIRAPDVHIEQPDIEALLFKRDSKSLISRIFKENAEALEKYGKDVLLGDFSVLDIIEKGIKKRVK